MGRIIVSNNERWKEKLSNIYEKSAFKLNYTCKYMSVFDKLNINVENYYEILEVNKKAYKEVIEKAYKVLVKKYHPDLYQGDKSFAEKKTQEINEAYEILSNPEKRKNYNLQLTFVLLPFSNAILATSAV